MVTISANTAPLHRALIGAKKQIPFATATAVNDLAFQVMRAENAAITSLFDHPRPFTQRATQVEQRAKKSHLQAVVSLRPAQAKYLTPYETGGEHSLPGKALLVPVDARTDQYGQLPKGAIARMAAMPNVFVGTIHGITGFWQRTAPPKAATGKRAGKGQPAAAPIKAGLKLLLRFGTNKPVTKRLNFRARATALVRAKAPAAMKAAAAKALASMRP